MGMDDFAPYLKINGCFVVLNTSPQVKTIKIFNYPINYGRTRDLLQIPGVSEGDIRASLLKGEINHKIRAKDIIIICSDIDLLQFNVNQKLFLQNAGIVNGLDASGALTTLPYSWRQNIPLLGTKNGINTTFTTPEKFINGIFTTGDHLHIQVQHNGKELYENIDYIINESGGAGTGFDTINLTSIVPISTSVLFASYAVKV